MTLEFTAEHDALREAVRGFLAAKSTEAEVRRLAETESGFDHGTWRELAALGIPGLLISEELGGSGGSLVELGVVLEEAGRSLLPAPLLSTAVLASTLLLDAGDPGAQADYLPK